MAGILDGIDLRTRLAGQNRMELLLFRLHGRRLFGINVFKVREVVQCPPLNVLPQSHAVVRGVVTVRGQTIPVIDLSMAIGGAALPDPAQCFMVITEFNRAVQGFLVGGVDRIVNMLWQDVLPPPRGLGRNSYMTAVTNLDGQLVEIIDVEKVLSEVQQIGIHVEQGLIDAGHEVGKSSHAVLVVDDSSVARNQVRRTLEQLGIEAVTARDGRDGLAQLQAMVERGRPIGEQVSLVISDIEMPEMDGYTMTTAIRNDSRLSGLYIILHSSLSGGFNESLTRKVGANRFLPKFSPDELASVVLEGLREVEQGAVSPSPLS